MTGIRGREKRVSLTMVEDWRTTSQGGTKDGRAEDAVSEGQRASAEGRPPEGRENGGIRSARRRTPGGGLGIRKPRRARVRGHGHQRKEGARGRQSRGSTTSRGSSRGSTRGQRRHRRWAARARRRMHHLPGRPLQPPRGAAAWARLSPGRLPRPGNNPGTTRRRRQRG